MNNLPKIELKIFANIVIILIISFMTLNAQSVKSGQLDESEIASLVSKLQKKVLLTDSQVNSVKNILNSYKAELAAVQTGNSNTKYSSKQQLINDTMSKIISLLDEKQKMKFDIIKDGWWSSVIAEESD